MDQSPSEEPEETTESSVGEAQRQANYTPLQGVIRHEIIRRQLSVAEAAAQMGLPGYRFLSRMQTGYTTWRHIGLDRLRVIAAWLKLSPMEVFKLAEVVRPDDFIRAMPGEDGLDELLWQMFTDPRYGILLPNFRTAQALPRWTKWALLSVYQQASARRLSMFSGEIVSEIIGDLEEDEPLIQKKTRRLLECHVRMGDQLIQRTRHLTKTPRTETQVPDQSCA